MTISIPNYPIEQYHQGMQALFSSPATSCEATIHYVPLKVQCENCYMSTMPGVQSTNVYRTGGPYPFSSPEMCPYCLGLGYKESTVIDTVRLRTYFDKKSWNKIRVPIGIPDGSVWTIGKTEDLMKIRRAAYITLPNQNTTANPYTLFEEPIPWGFGKDRYFSAFFQRGMGK